MEWRNKKVSDNEVPLHLQDTMIQQRNKFLKRPIDTLGVQFNSIYFLYICSNRLRIIVQYFDYIWKISTLNNIFNPAWRVYRVSLSPPQFMVWLIFPRPENMSDFSGSLSSWQGLLWLDISSINHLKPGLKAQ